MLGSIWTVTCLFALSTTEHAYKTKRAGFSNLSFVDLSHTSSMVVQLSQLIKSLQWKKIMLIFDAGSYETVRELLLHHDPDIPATFLLQELNKELLSEHAFRSFFQSVHQRFFPKLNFILLADYAKGNMLLKMVDTADKELNRTTDFRHYSFWIQACTSVCQPPPGPHPVIHHLENVILLSPSNEIQDFLLWQLITVPKGREFSSHQTAGSVQSDIFQNVKFGLNNRTLIVSTLEKGTIMSLNIVNASLVAVAVQHFTVCFIQWKNDMFTMKRNNGYVGYCIDLLNSISSALNFSYEIIEPADGEWGTEVNGTWNGLVGQLERREIDLVIAALSIHQDREKVMDFLYPPVFTKADDIAYKRPEDDSTRWSIFLDSFSYPVLLLLLAVLITFTLILHVLLKNTDINREKKLWPYGISDQFLYTFGILLNRGVEMRTGRQSIRLLMFSWGIFGIIIASTYSAALVALFAVQKYPLPFKDLGELVRQTEYKWGFQSGHIREHIFRLSKGEDMKLAWEGAVEANKTDPDVLSKDILKHFAKLTQGKYALFESRHTLYGLMKNDCTINIIGQDVIWHQFGIGVPTDYPVKKDIESILSVIADSGLFDKWWKHWGVKEPDRCLPESKVAVIHLLDVASAFYLLCSGFGVALVVLLIEVMAKSSTNI